MRASGWRRTKMGSCTDTDEMDTLENMNLVNLINRDLEEARLSGESDEAICRMNSAHLEMEDASHTNIENTEIIHESNEIGTHVRSINNDGGDRSASDTLSNRENLHTNHTSVLSQNLSDSPHHDMLYQDNELQDDDNEGIPVKDSTGDETPDISEESTDATKALCLENEDIINEGTVTQYVSNIENVSSADAAELESNNISSNAEIDEKKYFSDDSSTSSDYSVRQTKILKLPQQLREANLRLKEESKKCENLRIQLDEERDAKEKMESSLLELQEKYDGKLKEEEEIVEFFDGIFPEGEGIGEVGLEDIRKKVVSLADQACIAEQKNKIIQGLRQELLDSQTRHQCLKESHEEEKEILKKELTDNELKQTELLSNINQLKQELELKTEHNRNTRASLQKIQKVSDERERKVNELTMDLTISNCDMEVMKSSIIEKDELIVQLKAELEQAKEIQVKDRAQKEGLQLKVNMLDSIKELQSRLENEINEISNKAKLRAAKIKFLKRHIRDIEEQRQKAENLTLVIPEMGRTIDELNEALAQQEANKQRQQEEQKRQMEEQQKEKELNIQMAKRAWEKSVLGIGRCVHGHFADVTSNSILTRSNSVPLLKPRPPSSRRNPSKNQIKTNSFVPTINSSFVQRYLEDRKTKQKTKQREEKMVPSKTQTSVYSLATKPSDNERIMHKHASEGNDFLNIFKNSMQEFPRILEWGDSEGPIDKALAVGNHVLASMNCECPEYNDTPKQQQGMVMFIGFVEGNEEDVYIGLRLEEAVGYTDGFIHGKRYFRCEPGNGAFVRLSDIEEILETEKKHVPDLTMWKHLSIT